MRLGAKTIESFLPAICRVLLRLLPIACLLILAQVDPSFAHRPYFTTVVPVDLPDGTIGEMRLLHGDGIIMADPVRLIVLDGAGRLIGYSRESVPISIICSADRKCVGYDHGEGLILEFDPTKSFAGPVVTDGLSANLWNAPRDASVNIRTRAPTSSEFAAVNIQMVKGNHADVVFIVIVGAFMGLLALVLKRFGIGSGLGFLIQFMIWIVILGLEFALLVYSIWPVFFGAVSDFVWLMSLCAGALGVVAVRLMIRVLKRMKRQPAQA